MARYLNPAKIGLLALLELYVEEAVPSDAVLPVLSFITSHLMDRGATKPGDRWSKAERTVNLVISIKDFERLLGSYPFLMGMPGRKLWDQFLAKLWNISSLYALHDFFENLTAMIARTKDELRATNPERGSPEPEDGIKIARNSPFGAFIRRAQLEYHRLQFLDSADLWKAFVKYRQPTVTYLKRKNPNVGRLSFDNVLLAGEQEDWNPDGVSALASVVYGDMLTSEEGEGIAVSTDDIEVLLEFQIEQMQKYGNRIPLEIQHQFQDLLQDSFLVPSLTHYLSFLDAWRAGDYPTAFDLLHRYFDYTMQYRDRLFYQYALMNLAVLQADFGCYKEAVAAMLETVTTARENRDMTCLNFALNWLFHFGRAHPELVQELESNSLLGSGRESLALLRVKAKESGMWALWSSVLLSEAKLGLLEGGSIATSLEHMVRSSQVIVEYNMTSMFGAQLALYSALWSRLGLTQLSSTACEIFLRCHASNTLFDDELKATCKLAFIMAERGEYDEALQKLDGLEGNSLRSWKPNQHWFKCRGIVRLKKDLHHNNLGGAEQLLGQLLQAASDEIDPEMSFTVDMLHIDYLVRSRDLQTAYAKVETLMEKFRDQEKDIALRVKLLTVKASLLDKCGRPLRGFSTAIRAANLAFRSRLIPHLWEAMGAVSNLLVSLSEFEAASQILDVVIPRSLECEMPSVSAKLYSHLADACMGLAGNAERKSSRRSECMTRALAAVQRSFDHYSSIQDIGMQAEMMAKKATIMKLSGEKQLALDYAGAYLELKKQAKSLSISQA